MIKDNDNKLYRIENKLGTFYIVAKSFDAAAEALKERLDKADDGLFSYREVKNIELLATEHFSYADATKQSFNGDGANLIVTGGAAV